jgi:BCCT family betaine/carnitine transporter
LSARVDRINFSLAVAVLVSLSTPLLIFPETSAVLLKQTYSLIAHHFGWLYIVTGASAFSFVLWLGLGRFSDTRLGTEQREFSTVSWAAMLFAAGVGAGLMYWSAIEWAFYVDTPPFNAEPRSEQAYMWAASYGLHHWGFIAWSLYCLPTLAISYAFYVRKVPYLKYSIVCDYWLEGREHSAYARALDGLFMIALLGGAGSSLGFSTPLIASLIGRLTGIPVTFELELAVVGICVLLFSGSVWLGLGRGIRRLSDLNVIVALLMLAIIFVLSDTLFLLNMAVNTIGHLIQNTVQMAMWTDPITQSGFVEDWTIFYWAWWVAYGPFVGLFVTRISRGRTFREVVVGMLTFGSLGCWIFYMILGHHGLALQVSGELDVLQAVASSGGNQAIINGLDQLPWADLILVMFVIVCVVFCATTYDSASYTLAASATHSLHPSEDPPRWHRLFWAVTITLLPVALMFVGGMKEAQTAVLIVSLPLCLTLWLAGFGLLKSLQATAQRVQKN